MSHSDETDPVRIQQIIDRAILDAEWLMKKVSVLISDKVPKYTDAWVGIKFNIHESGQR